MTEFSKPSGVTLAMRRFNRMERARMSRRNFNANLRALAIVGGIVAVQVALTGMLFAVYHSLAY